jgi:hypothetical protein
VSNTPYPLRSPFPYNKHTAHLGRHHSFIVSDDLFNIFPAYILFLVVVITTWAPGGGPRHGGGKLLLPPEVGSEIWWISGIPCLAE